MLSGSSSKSCSEGISPDPGPPTGPSETAIAELATTVPGPVGPPCRRGPNLGCVPSARRRIVGYSIDSRMTAALAVNALRNPLALRGRVDTVVHSDRGSQFRSHAYVSQLRRARLRGSMRRVGACADNAAMGSFFSLLQKNVLNQQRWQTREQLRLAIVLWIERTYHRRRRQDALGRMTPIA